MFPKQIICSQCSLRTAAESPGILGIKLPQAKGNTISNVDYSNSGKT